MAKSLLLFGFLGLLLAVAGADHSPLQDICVAQADSSGKRIHAPHGTLPQKVSGVVRKSIDPHLVLKEFFPLKAFERYRKQLFNLLGELSGQGINTLVHIVAYQKGKKKAKL